MTSKKIIARAPGKIILFGEHAVVHQMPAIATAVDKTATVELHETNELSAGSVLLNVIDYNDKQIFDMKRLDYYTKPNISPVFHPLVQVLKQISLTTDENINKGLEISIKSDIPRGAGMGSSAAVSVALTAVLGQYFSLNLSLDAISQIAFIAEKIVHGNPSGIDNSTCTYGGGIMFEKGNVQTVSIPKIAIVVGDTRKPRQTKLMVGKVGQRKEKWNFYSRIIEAIGALVKESIPLLIKGDEIALGELCDINHGLLDALGVSSPELNHLVEIARQKGAWGANLTGGGGGGCMIALCSHDVVEPVCKSLISAGGYAYQMSFQPNGVTIFEE